MIALASLILFLGLAALVRLAVYELMWRDREIGSTEPAQPLEKQGDGIKGRLLIPLLLLLPGLRRQVVNQGR
jgi:hypothetical protein